MYSLLKNVPFLGCHRPMYGLLVCLLGKHTMEAWWLVEVEAVVENGEDVLFDLACLAL